MRKGYIFITKSGFDPGIGKHVKDPYFGEIPTLGACRPDLRKNVESGDFLFLVSGKVKNYPQYIVGAIEVDKKIKSRTAYRRFPELRLHETADGQLDGNIIITSSGDQHPLDNHENFERRRDNYIVGKRNPIVLETPDEIARGRERTMPILRELFGKDGEIPRDIIGRMSKLDDQQVTTLVRMLHSLKADQRRRVMRAVAGGAITDRNRSRITLPTLR